MDFYSLASYSRARHAELIAEAQREALYAKLADKAPSLITRIANLFSARKPAQTTAPRTAPAK